MLCSSKIRLSFLESLLYLDGRCIQPWDGEGLLPVLSGTDPGSGRARSRPAPTLPSQHQGDPTQGFGGRIQQRRDILDGVRDDVN